MIICNTSPLIALAVIDRLDLLDALFGEWLAPKHVARESTIDGKPFSRRLSDRLPGHVVNVEQNPLVDALSLTLDRGEAEVIALAEAKGSYLVLMDDRKGRRVARTRNLRVIGTVGVLLRAQRQGRVIKIRPLLDEMIRNSIRVSRALYAKALVIAQEPPDF